jgi:WD40 repeat protein
MSPDGDRSYSSAVHDDPETGSRCEIWTYDPDRRQRIAPTIELAGEFDDECSFDAHVSGTRDGRRVVVTTGTSNYSLRTTTVYDGRTGEQLAGPLHGPIVTSVSPDGVLVGGADGTITQYDVETLEPIGTFPGTQNLVTHLSFSADGKILVAGSLNQTLSIYDVATRTRLGDPVAEDLSYFVGAAVRPDGRAVATNSPDGVAVWDIDPEHLADAACQVAGRNLTRSEWDTYLGHAGDYRATCPNYD